MPVDMPTVEQVRQLPRQLQATVPPAWQDINGHVNVQHYMEFYDDSGWPLFASIGIDAERIEREGIGFFDLEHHTWFLAEMHVGDTISAYTRLLALSAKRIHGVMFIVNDSRAVLASALEFVSTSADLRTRRTVPTPADVAERIRGLVEEQGKLGWAAPVSGAIRA
jgi:acyl-CoA thioester hydrolase